MGKKITRDEFLSTLGDYLLSPSMAKEPIRESLWSRIQEAQASEPMSVDQIEPVLREVFLERFGGAQPTTEWMDLLLKMAKSVQPLTVQQGFVPDFAGLPEDATCVVIRWSSDKPESWSGHSKLIKVIPRPAPKIRQKTREEKIADLRRKSLDTDTPWDYSELKDSTIDDLCRAAGIPLEVAE